MMKQIIAIAAALLSLQAFAQDPMELGRRVADKVVDNTRFEFEYVLGSQQPDIITLDFGRSLSPATGVAYALSTLECEADQTETFGLGCAAPVKIWIDDRLVFSRTEPTGFVVEYSEKSYNLPESFTVKLTKGEHKILIKSANTALADWQFIMQSPNVSRYGEKGRRIRPTLKKYAPKVAETVNWLVIGGFPGDINTVCPPEKTIELYKVYDGVGGRIAWDVPRINLLTQNIKGGKSFYWSYHVGCFNWALQRFAVATGDSKYADYAARWCDYALSTEPMARYMTLDLLSFRSMNFGKTGRPMLDYYSAPAMSFVTRLADQGDTFEGWEKYRKTAADVVDYLRHKQFRIDGIFAREYTPYPSIWADDMYMGIPYLVYWARYTADKAEREALLDDASSQILTFNKFLCEPSVGLYRQACYPSHPEQKVPFWSRGNGWAIWATSEVLAALPKNHKNYKPLMEIYKKHVDGLLKVQTADGFWRNILDSETSMNESSGTAIFTLCIARGINNGWIPHAKYGPALERGWKALATFVDEKGDVNGVKGGTNFSTDPADYERVAFVVSDTHGLLPFVFACIEMDAYFRGAKK